MLDLFACAAVMAAQLCHIPVISTVHGTLDIYRAPFNRLFIQSLAGESFSLSIYVSKTLKGIIPICSYCHSIRDDQGAWDRVEAYLSKHSDAELSHGICPKCLGKARLEFGLDAK